MISAAEAAIDKIMETLDKYIQTEAELGNRFINLDVLSDERLRVVKERYRSPELTRFQQKVKDRLSVLRYGVKISTRTARSGGLGCMDDDPPDVELSSIEVSW
jgi:hypothetical protein